MENLLIKYASEPKSAILNFELAAAYKEKKHFAGACSYFLRCAEWAQLPQENNLVYEALIQISLCFRELGNRQWTEEGWLLHAVSLMPGRPEAYWLLSLFYERQKKWQECYMYAKMGLNCPEAQQLLLNIGYEGPYVLEFQRGVSAWWISRTAEAREVFLTMPYRFELSENYINYVQNNLNSIGVGSRTFEMYSPEKLEKFRFPFPCIEKIEKNYSQVFQDMFVLAAREGKENGYYLEIGSSDPFHVNNTFLLESKFGWKGISIDINEEKVASFVKSRKNSCICVDATVITYWKLLKGFAAPADIDYLQIDCEPPATSYRILTSIPFDHFRFAVITYEHDHFVDASKKYRQLSREFLQSKGYILLVSNVSSDANSPFEDWWVHPALVSEDIIMRMQCNDDKIHQASVYMLDKNVLSEKSSISDI
jgi:hypothetical protein